MTLETTHGMYSELRYLRASIKADEQYLSAAPLGPTRKKRLAKAIADDRVKLKALNARIRAYRASQRGLTEPVK